jgi:transcription initiation factor TFIID subunit TAF12
MSGVTVEQLKLKSNQAQEMIQKLRKQIELIKQQTTPEFMKEKEKQLEKENAELKQRVQQLVKELEQAEASSGSLPLGNVTNTAQPAQQQQAEKPKQEQKPQQQKQQQQQQQPKQKQEQKPAKQQESKKS